MYLKSFACISLSSNNIADTVRGHGNDLRYFVLLQWNLSYSCSVYNRVYHGWNIHPAKLNGKPYTCIGIKLFSLCSYVNLDSGTARVEKYNSVEPAYIDEVYGIPCSDSIIILYIAVDKN